MVSTVLLALRRASITVFDFFLLWLARHDYQTLPNVEPTLVAKVKDEPVLMVDVLPAIMRVNSSGLRKAFFSKFVGSASRAA